MGKRAGTKQVVREIHRRTRRRFSAEEKGPHRPERLRGEQSRGGAGWLPARSLQTLVEGLRLKVFNLRRELFRAMASGKVSAQERL
jgi:hypothetical protein